jgi:sec-independent protein translocase protein TatC
MTESASELGSGNLMSHLIELRDRVMRMVISILGIFLCLFYWANDIYTYLAGPLTRHMPEGSTMIAIDVASPFLTPFKLVLMLSIFLSMPVILYQFWAFVAPGLYTKEKRIAGPLLVSSILLFYGGMAFAFYVVFPLVFGFFTSVGPEMISISTDIGRYLDFVLSLFFGFGLAFEVPIATIILVAAGITTPKKLGQMRPYVIVGAFVIGMLLTPPDIISQVLLAVPMWILFEAGLIASAIMFKDRNMDSTDDDEELDETGFESPEYSPSIDKGNLATSSDSKSEDLEKSRD